ncbi:MAG: hypothetical protein IKK03_11635 [Lachnospiraceae bacterium]|nr:hypothetical protein [Lachnospiraceae bacterium]
MKTPKVIPGTGGAFGGISPELNAFGIPVACCTDRPSGIRMDVGTFAFSIPIGTCLACSFNEPLQENLFEMVGIELRRNKIDSLLGPGMNLHRNPLNGRNFEYFSEDPFLTGKIASAQVKGMHKHQLTGTIKHFIANNQEHQIYFSNGVISERPIRELYLKGFEIACREAGAYCIMTTYGPVNGLWTASNYDLLTHILRKEWEYEGVVMTDWWARGNEEGEDSSKQEFAAMVRSQNDLYMVTKDAITNSNNDNLATSLHTDKLTLGELQRSAMNVLKVIMRMLVMDRYLDCEDQSYKELYEQTEVYEIKEAGVLIDVDCMGCIPTEYIGIRDKTRNIYKFVCHESGDYQLEFNVRASGVSEAAQMSMSVWKDNEFIYTISMNGSQTDFRTATVELGNLKSGSTKIELFFRKDGMEINSCKIIKK